LDGGSGFIIFIKMNFTKFLKNVSTIKFDKAFGLDIGDRSIEIIELEKFFRFSVSTYGRVELPAGIVEGGRILDPNFLAEKLKKLLKEIKPKKVSNNKVILSLAESQTFLQCFTVDSSLKSGALLKVIIEKASLTMPFNLEKVYWDFMEKPLADKTKKMIVFISVPKDIANGYVKFCNSIGLEVISLSVEALSLGRTILKTPNKHNLIMDIGSTSTNLSFFDGSDKISLAVTIPVAGENMSEEIKYKLQLELSEAEALKVKFGFKESKENTVRPVILPIFEDVLKETKGAIEYYENTFNQKVENIYIIGGSALLPGIVEVVKESLKRDAQIASCNSNIDLNILNSNNNKFPLFANVIGLGMLAVSGEFKDLNLLKRMPSSEVNSVNKLNLFSMGYLSRVNTFRAVMNNKFVLVVMILLIGVIFFVLLQQTKNFGLDDITTKQKVNTSIKPKNINPIATSTRPNLGTSTALFPSGTSTRSNTGSISTSTKIKSAQ
jgi:type IV pilus assembly protein PilM